MYYDLDGVPKNLLIRRLSTRIPDTGNGLGLTLTSGSVEALSQCDPG